MTTTTAIHARLKLPGEGMLLGVRVGLGLWLAGAAVVSRHFTGLLGISDLICAALVIGISVASLRWPKARYSLLAVTTWIGCSPFLLSGASNTSWGNEWFIGMALLFLAPPRGEWFIDD